MQRGTVDDVVLSVSIAHIWNSVREIRKKVGLLLTAHPLDLQVAATMATTELMENAVKYGQPVSRAPEILFDLSVTDDVMEICTLNGFKDSESMKRLDAIVRRIADADDPAKLYMIVIEAKAEHVEPGPRSGLGLYRIAAEGRFTLTYDCRDEVVRVCARRSVP